MVLQYKENSQLLLTKELNKSLQKFYLLPRKRDDRLVIVRQNCYRWQQ